MKKHAIRNYILFGLFGAAEAAILIGMILLHYDLRGILFIGAMLLIMQIAAVLIYQNDRRYIRQVVISLSELIAVITELQDQQLFPDAEDTLLSKLQTQVLKLTGILKQQNEKIEYEKEEIKSLISDISHQIKTPVAALKMYGEFIKDKETTDEERNEYLEVMEAALIKLDFFTESMIKISRLEGGIIQLRPEVCSFNETILGAVMQIYGKAMEKEIMVSFEEKAGQIELNHDRRWTEEAICNLLDNAVKYSNPGGKIQIVLDKYETYVRLDISDTGASISEDEQAHIFKRFYRGIKAMEQEGMGLGLYLCRKIVMDQGGYIKYTASKNGNMFSVFLKHR